MAVNESLIVITETLRPFITDVNAVLSFLKLVTGGLFGLYLILVVLRFYEARMVKRELKQMRNDIKEVKALVTKKKRKK